MVSEDDRFDDFHKLFKAIERAELVEKCDTCGKYKTIKYRVKEWISDGEIIYHDFCCDKCLFPWVKKLKLKKKWFNLSP